MKRGRRQTLPPTPFLTERTLFFSLAVPSEQDEDRGNGKDDNAQRGQCDDRSRAERRFFLPLRVEVDLSAQGNGLRFLCESVVQVPPAEDISLPRRHGKRNFRAVGQSLFLPQQTFGVKAHGIGTQRLFVFCSEGDVFRDVFEIAVPTVESEIVFLPRCRSQT